MNSEELVEHLKNIPDIELRSIRVFQKSFHINFWTNTSKITVYYKRPLSAVKWNDIKRDFKGW